MPVSFNYYNKITLKQGGYSTGKPGNVLKVRKFFLWSGKSGNIREFHLETWKICIITHMP